MIVGLTIWGDRISPVFDSCHMLKVATIKNSMITYSRVEPFEPLVPFLLLEKLKELKIEVLICGAISREPSIILETSGIVLIPFISGTCEEILHSYIKGEALTKKYMMPGCGKKNKQKGCKNKRGSGVGCI